MKHQDQRVAIFIDVQNLYYSAKALYDAKVNFAEIVNSATANRKLVRAIAYTIKADMPEEQSFFDALEKLGIEVKTKELQTFVNGAKKGDWDVGIAVDMLKMAPKLDAVILCSGDGDFQMLLHHAKAEGCRAEVLSFGKSTSQKLIEEADDFIDLDNDEKYLLKYQPQNQTQSQRQPKEMTLEDKVISEVNKDNHRKKVRIFGRK
jgi:uncharacterized LabA/DUF88 family protein